MSSPVASEELASLVTSVKALRDEVAVVAGLEPPDPERADALQRSFAELTLRVEAHLDDRLRFDVRTANADWTGDAASVARLGELLRRIDDALAIGERLRSHRRGPALVAASVLLGVLAAIGLVLTVVSVFAAVISFGAEAFVDGTRRGISSALFYGFLAVAFAALAFALWRRGDPRPHLVGGRALSALAAIAIVASIASSSAI